MFRNRTRSVLGGIAALTAATLVVTAQPASAIENGRLSNELNWSPDFGVEIHSQDSVAEAEDTDTNSIVDMWRSNTPGDNSIAWRVNQGGTVYPIQGANAISASAPSVAATSGMIWAFHRGTNNEIFWAFASMATPTTGSNFRLSAWRAIPGISTSATPVPVVVGDNILLAYRGSTNNQLYAIHAPISGLRNGQNSAWTGNAPTGFLSDSSPGVASIGNTTVMVFRGTDNLLRIAQSQNLGASWSGGSTVSGSPSVSGRPSVAISGNMMDIVALRNDADGQGAHSIVRRQFSVTNTVVSGSRGVNPITAWVFDPENWRSISAVLIYGVPLLAGFARIFGTMRGAGDTNGQHFHKLLSSRQN